MSDRNSYRKKLFNTYNKNVQPDYYIKGIRENWIQRVWHRKKNARILSLLDGRKGLILDTGSGNGVLCCEANKKGYDIVGLDLSLPFTSFAKRIFHELQFTWGDALELPFVDDTFDVVVCAETLEHLSDLKKAVKEVHRVLKINGIFVNLNQDDEHPLWKLSWFFWQKLTGRIWRETHIVKMTPKIIYEILIKNGFMVEKIEREHFTMSFAMKSRKVS